MNPASVYHSAMCCDCYRDSIYSAAESFLRGTFAADHASSPLYQHLFRPESDILRGLFEQLPACVVWFGPGCVFSLVSLLKVAEDRRPSDDYRFVYYKEESETWIASHLLFPSFDAIAAYRELEQAVIADPAPQDVLFVLLIFRDIFPGPPGRMHNAPASFLEAASAASSLPYPGTGPEYGRATAWIDGVETTTSFPDCVENSTRQLIALLFLQFIDGIWSFDLDAIRATSARSDLAEFFGTTQPSDLMREDQKFRTKWAKVMSCLAGGDGIPAPLYITRTPDRRLENEVRAGLISQVRVFAAIFRLQSDVSVDWTVDQVAADFERLLNLVNPKRPCTVTVVEWWQAEITRMERPEPVKEFGGHFWIQVKNQETGKVVGSMLLRETPRINHSEVLGVRTFPEGFSTTAPA
jgi:hypothetical protein